MADGDGTILDRARQALSDAMDGQPFQGRTDLRVTDPNQIKLAELIRDMAEEIADLQERVKQLEYAIPESQ